MSAWIDSVLLNAQGQLRSGWKLGAYFLVLLVVWVGVGVTVAVPFTASDLAESLHVVLVLNAVVGLAGAVIPLVFMVRVVERIPLAAFGVGFNRGWRYDLALGLLIGLVMVLVLLGAAAAVTELDVRWGSREDDRFWIAPLLTVAAIVVSAASEELVFRGYPMQVLMTGIGRWPAVSVMSLLFGLVHQANPNFTWLGLMNTILAGVLLSVAYLRTRSLWLPYGIHAAWNLGLGPILGFPVSGLEMASIWTTRGSGVEWIAGGPYGPEGGLIGTIVFAAALRAVLSIRWIGVSPEVRSILSAHPTQVYAEP